MIRDTRLWEKALKERWPIPEAMRAGVIKSLLQIIANPEAKPREKTAAARALMAADAQNIEMEKMRQADEHEHRARLVAIAKHIGFDEVARLASENGFHIENSAGTLDQMDGAGTTSSIPEQEAGGAS